jgi:hypothetical protein
MQNQLPHSDEDLKSARYSGVALGIVITLLLGWILTLLDPMPPISSDDSSATGPVQVFIQMPPAPEESNASPNSEQSSATPTTDNPYYYSESEHNTSKTVEVYPAVGNKRGVISHGTSVLNDPSSDGKSYHCRKQYRQFTVTYLAQVEYNGTAVHYTEESDPDGQFYAIMYFDGENLNSFKP